MRRHFLLTGLVLAFVGFLTLTLSASTSRVISYLSVLLFVGGLGIVGYGLTSKTFRKRKYVVVCIAILIVLGWFDGIVVKESFFESIRLAMGISSIVVWISISVLFALRIEGKGTGKEGWTTSEFALDQYIYATSYKFAHETHEDWSAFVIAGLLLLFPFLLVAILVR